MFLCRRKESNTKDTSILSESTEETFLSDSSTCSFDEAGFDGLETNDYSRTHEEAYISEDFEDTISLISTEKDLADKEGKDSKDTTPVSSLEKDIAENEDKETEDTISVSSLEEDIAGNEDKENRKTMRKSTMRNRFLNGADAAAGTTLPPRTAEDLFEDIEPVLLLGMDIGHLSRKIQFLICATGVFGFSLLYGYWQELISVHICNRQLGLFLAVAQFSGYTIWSYILRTYVYKKQKKREEKRSLQLPSGEDKNNVLKAVPFIMYLGLSVLRAIDLGMTNLAMQYVNYPAKTLMKSSRVVFTMLFGVLIFRKRYRILDYLIVLLMVTGLAIFMHADATSSAVFNPMGITMLTVSLICDGAISNMSEIIMTNFGVGQDEFIFRMYSIALIAITAAAALKGDLLEGMAFLTQPGTYAELDLPYDERTWSVAGKTIVIGK